MIICVHILGCWCSRYQVVGYVAYDGGIDVQQGVSIKVHQESEPKSLRRNLRLAKCTEWHVGLWQYSGTHCVTLAKFSLAVNMAEHEQDGGVRKEELVENSEGEQINCNKDISAGTVSTEVDASNQQNKCDNSEVSGCEMSPRNERPPHTTDIPGTASLLVIMLF